MSPLAGWGQGFSFHTYYSPDIYEASPQNWTAEVDSNGYIHFGNGNGILTFNGTEWISTHIGETGRGQAIYITESGQINVYGRHNFGMLVPDSLNRISYRSMSQQFYRPHQIAPYVWDVYEIDSLLYKRHVYGIAVYDSRRHSLKDYTIPGYEGHLRASFRVGDNILVDTDAGLWRFRDSSFSKVRESDIPGSEVFEDQRLFFAAPMDEGSYLLGSTNKSLTQSYLYHFDGTRITLFPTEADRYLDEHWLYDGLKMDKNRIALATISGGVVFIDNNGKLLKIFNERTGLRSNAVYDLFLDHENTLWLNLSDGIQKLSVNETVWNLAEFSGLSGAVTNIVANEGDIYVRTMEGLFISTLLNPENVLAFERINMDQSLHGLASWRGSVFAYGDDGIVSIAKGSEPVWLSNQPVTDWVRGDNESSVITFIAPGKKIVFNGKEFTEIPLDVDAPVKSSVHFQGNLYLVVDSKRVQKFNKKEQGPVPVQYDSTGEFYINQLGVINGDLYLAAEGSPENGGLYVYEEVRNEFVKSTFLEGHKDIYSSQVFSFNPCSESEVWFRANQQLLRAVKEQGKWTARKSPYQRVGRDLINFLECDGNGIWLGGKNSLTHISNPDWNYKTDFKTNITGIFIRNDSLIYGGFGEPVQEIVLPYKDNELRFTYAAASYIDPGLNSYQVKLEGFDNNWSEWTSETQKDYTNIPEGEYVFKVRSKNVYEVRGEEALISFAVLPPWYRTAWAYMTYVLLFSSLIYSIHRFRINNILREQRVRNRIASDLHDEVSATLSSISYFAQAIRQDSNGREERFVGLIAESANEAKEKITDISWSIDPENDDWEILLAKCRRFASDLLESKGMEYELHIDSTINRPLKLELRQHLWLIFKEMVTNAARHSEATKVDIGFQEKGGVLTMKVQDNGRGFDAESKREGYGVKNIKKRADKIHADLSLKTDRQIGTRWVLKVKI